jgi:hypothetical protein
MQSESKSLNHLYLDGVYPVYLQFKRLGTVSLDYRTRAELLRIAREEIDARYFVDINCGGCIPQLLNFVFNYYEKHIHTPNGINWP